MLFAVCSDRGAPGSSTAARALAAARGLPAVVVGADPYGDDMALRLRPDGNHPLPAKPTVLGIGAGGNASRGGENLWRDGSHELSPLVRVVPGFMTAEQGASLRWQVLATDLEAQTVPVFADLGRIHNGSPSMPIAAAADALIPVCRGDQVSVQSMVGRLEALVAAVADQKRQPPVVVPVVVAPRKQGERIAASVTDVVADSAAAPAVRGVAWLAWDPRGVLDLDNGSNPWAKPLLKSPLMRSARGAIGLLGEATGLDHAEPVRKYGHLAPRDEAGSQTAQASGASGEQPTEQRAAEEQGDLVETDVTRSPWVTRSGGVEK